MSNYRGFSLLSCTYMVLEKPLFEKFYAVTKDVLSNDQLGLCQNRSTTTQMIIFFKEIHSGLNSETLSALYLGFQKAFNEVCHEKLLEKLYYCGFSGVLNALIESYLTNRRERLTVESLLSEEETVNSGVPQGSVLGALFLILFIDDLSNCPMSKCFGYANDLKVVSDSSVTLQIGAARLWKWSNKSLFNSIFPNVS